MICNSCFINLSLTENEIQLNIQMFKNNSLPFNNLNFVQFEQMQEFLRITLFAVTGCSEEIFA